MTRFASPSIISFFIAILILSAFAAPLGAQTASARLEGIVWDPTGEPLTGVILAAVDEASGRQMETISDSEGYYRFLALPPGIYTVTAKSKAFKDVVHRHVRIYLPDTLIDNFSFEVSAIDKEVPPAAAPKINDSTNSGAFSPRDMQALPLIDRNPLPLGIYQPNVQTAYGMEDDSTVSGTRKVMNSIMMDGLSITDPVSPSMQSSFFTPNPESISTLQIVTSAAKAEFGGAGGGHFILATPSGTKSFTGSVYDYFRNKRLNANDFFNNTLHYPRPGLASNIYGVTLSGPIGGNSLFFINFEGNHTDQQLIRERAVLTETARAGLFRWYAPDDLTRDSSTVKSFDIAANDPRGLGIDPQITAALAKVPEPNDFTVGDGLNIAGYRFDALADIRQKNAAARIDHYLNANHQLFVRFNYGDADSTDSENGAEMSYPNELNGTYVNNSWAVAVGSDWAISPYTVNEFRVGYIQPKIELKRPARLSTPMLLANSWTNPADPSFPRSYKVPAFEIADNLSRSMNRHSLKFGISYRKSTQTITDYDGVYPNVTFGRDHGNIPDISVGPEEQFEISTEDREWFERIYNNLLGRIESVNQTFNSTLTSALPAGTARIRDYSTSRFSAFIQDDWKIRRNLTLNLGMRLETMTSPKEKNGLQSVLDKAADLGPASEISDFNVAARDSWYSTKWNNFAPRFGFAWDVMGSGNTVLRGAYGIYFSHLHGGITDFVDKNSYGFIQTATLYPNTGGGDFRLSDGIPLPAQPSPVSLTPAATRSTSIAVLNPELKTPRVEQFSLTLEKKLWGLLFDLGYSATRGKDLFQYVNLNQTKTRGDFLQAYKELKQYRDEGTPVPDSNTLLRIFGYPLAAFEALDGANFDSGEAGIAANELDLNCFGDYAAAGVSDFYIRNFPQFDGFLYGSNSAESWFDSFRLGIRKATNNLHFQTYYTWSKSLDTISSDGNTYVNPSDSFQPEIDKAPSDFHRTHVWNAVFDYALPYGRTRNPDSETPKWIDWVFGGWNLGSIMLWESGQRFSVYSGRQNLFADVSSLANLEGKRTIGTIYKFSGNIYWFNPDQALLFTHPDAGEAASSGRNTFVGPRYFNMDAVIHKRFHIGEKRYVQFRAEAYNVFNNTHFGLPNTDIDSSIFGIIRRTQGSPRSLQVALRLQF
ncbi:MAG: TonB-dependent receptor [Acidobacteria bacterium]|nr:TonB-dependent receptor [Acidobacteriota bacterium]